MKIYILLFISLTFFSPLSAQQRLYVHPSASGASNGSTWADAFTDLQLALQSAHYGDTMWVAEGTYLPTSDGNRDSSFNVPNGLRMYGGFAGTETALTERDWAAHPVILSGNIGNPQDSTDNSYNIMFLAYPDSFTIVDGFTFRHGYAEPVPLVTQTGFEPAINGGAMYIEGFEGAAYPDIRNCIFEYNYARSAGGAVFINGSGEDASVAPRFLNCVFQYNRTLGYGGAVYRYGGSWAERYPDFGDCLFEKNYAKQWGGGLYYFDTERTDTLHFSGCRFVENEGEQDAGAMALTIGRIAGASMIIRKCEFNGNLSITGEISAIRQNASLRPLINFSLFDSKFIGQNDLIISLLGYFGDGISTKSFSNCSVYNCHGAVSYEAQKIVFTNTDVKNSTFGVGLYANSTLTQGVVEINSNRFRNSTLGIKCKALGNLVNISNNLFVNNSFTRPTAFEFQNSNQYPAPIIKNSSFVNNTGTPQNFQPGPSPFNDHDVIYQNCLFYGSNIDTIPLPPFPSYENQITFKHCYFDAFGCSDQLYFTNCDAGTIIGGDPGFIDTASGDYRLSACSMLRDAGSNEGLSNVLTDFNGNPRIQDGTVDIGAYETPGFVRTSAGTAVPICSETESGNITLNASGGCEPYAVAWQNGAQNGSGLSGLSAGTYYLSVTDQGGRLLRDTVAIQQGGYPQVDSIVQPVVCGQTTGGSATLLASGGQEPYTYQWANGNSTASIDGLSTGVYRVTVRDAAGCTTLAEAVVNPSGTLDLSAEVTSITCLGANDGVLSVDPLDGLSPYIYQWTGGLQGSTAANLSAGFYRVTVIDALGCSGSYLFSLTEPTVLTAAVDSTAASGLTIPDGSLSAQGQGGTGPYQYAWSSGDQTAVADMLLPGSYELTLTDLHGCTFTGTYSVPYTIGLEETGNQPSALLYPNPASASTALYLRNWPAKPAVVEGWDASGRKVLSQSILLTDGSDVISLSVGDLAVGSYRLVVQAGDMRVQVSLIIVR